MDDDLSYQKIIANYQNLLVEPSALISCLMVYALPLKFVVILTENGMNTIKVIAVVLLVSACSSRSMTQQYEPHGAVSIQFFYDHLSPYGAWVNYPPYGYAWIPDVGFGFSPYVTAGHWVFTRYGWTWYSYYNWGWAPFHYGRWYFDSFYGWVWLPDTYWAPAWVVWRIGGGYCGWAPLGPNININMAISGSHTIPHEHWTFVRDKDVSNRNIDRYRMDRSKNSTFANKATLIRQTREHQNVVYAPGPDRTEIQKAMGKPVAQREIKDRNRPGSGRITNEGFDLFKPQVQKKETDNTRPGQVFELQELRKHSERPAYRSPSGGRNNIYKTNPSVRPSPSGPAPSENRGRGKPGKKRGN
jgi:hypothetical protein